MRLRPSRTHVPPIEFLCPVSIAKGGGTWLSEPFRTHIDGSELQLNCDFNFFSDCNCVNVSILSDCKLRVTVNLINHRDGKKGLTFKLPVNPLVRWDLLNVFMITT